MQSRIGKRLKALDLPDVKSYLKYLSADTSQKELVELIDVISTNVTSFFREKDHFSTLTNCMTDWARRGQRRFRVWSAACSTGEEPYSLAITLQNLTGTADRDVKILATDISTQVLKKCRDGIFHKDKLMLVDIKDRKRFFVKLNSQNGEYYQVHDGLKQMVVVKRLNLIQHPYPMKGPLDVIFCRNVMIYFQNETRVRLLKEFYRLLKPGGYLFVGHAESLTGDLCQLEVVGPSVYRKPETNRAL